MINEINKKIFNIKIVIYLILNFHTIFFKILNYHINYIKKIHLEIKNKIVKTIKFNILIIYNNNYYFKNPYVTNKNSQNIKFYR